MLIRVEPLRNGRYMLIGMALALALGSMMSIYLGSVTPGAKVAPPSLPDFGKLPLSFEPNTGQTDPSVRFMAHASGGTMYFTPSEVVLSLSAPQEKSPELADPTSEASKPLEPASTPSTLRLQFLASNPDVKVESGEQLPGKVNYFIGSDPSQWHTDLPTYATTYYRNLYPGIDLQYEGTGGQLKGTYTVTAGTDPSLIRWRYEGAQGVHIDEAGNMQVLLKGDGGITVTEQAPVAWQDVEGQRVAVAVRYLLAPDNTVSFVPGSYNSSYPLIIDPTLSYSTYLGGGGDDYGRGITVDASGNAYVSGHTRSTNFPLQNPIQPVQSGLSDVFVTKFNSTGTSLIYSTYLGGSSIDQSYSIALDGSGRAYVTGITSSTNFPILNAFQPVHGGIFDAFVAKLSATGSTLIYSTFLGGSSDEEGHEIAVDMSGNAYVTGFTDSTNFPLQDPFRPSYGGGPGDAFVTKLSASGSTLVYSTYLGESGDDVGFSIAVDTSGSAYVTGGTTSANFPLQDPFQPILGGADAFVTKFNPAGSALVYSTFLGGDNYDAGRGIAVDTNHSAYIAGITWSSNFPLQNAFQPTLGGNEDAFVTRFSATGTTLIYSTYLGGSSEERGEGIAVDSASNAHVTGYTASLNFPLQSPIQPSYGGNEDAFVTRFSALGSTVIYSTYLGGSREDGGRGITADASGDTYVTGYTFSSNFALHNPFQPSNAGGFDAFVSKISDQQGTPTPQATSTVTRTATRAPTQTPGGPTATTVPPTACAIQFTDVPSSNTFYPFVRCLACQGITGGYPCGGTGEPCNATNDPYFRPNNNITRGQIAKIVSESAGFTEPAGSQIYEDVPSASPFYLWINRLSNRGVMGGYLCGVDPAEPCGPENRPYFRPSANATRGQLAKIVSEAAGFDEQHTSQTFEDVPTTNTFYIWVERLVSRQIMGGYVCGSVGEPCNPPGSRPYFRWGNTVTRGQASKIVANTFFPNCTIQRQ